MAVPPKAFSELPKSWRLTDQGARYQFLGASLVLASLCLIAFAVTFLSIRQQTQGSEVLIQNHAVISRLHLLSRDYYRQQTSLLEFLRTRNIRLIRDLTAERNLFDQNLKRIRSAVGERTDSFEVLQKLSDHYRAWSSLSDQLVALDTPELGVLDAESDAAKKIFTGIDLLIDQQIRALSANEDAQKELQANLLHRLWLCALLLIALMGVCLLYLYRSLGSPIASLAQTLDRYEAGEFEHRAEITSRSEVGRLQTGMNALLEKTEIMVRDLRHLDDLKTDFVSTVSHELKTPLTSIAGYVKLIAAGDAGPLTRDQREFLEIVDQNVERLTLLINDILDVEKMESGHVQVSREPQDLVLILHEVKDSLALQVKKKGLEFRFQVPSRISPVMGEKNRLVQIFLNLLSNAIKYTEKGYVEIRAEQKDFAVFIQIKDSGIGISEEDQEKLFQKFYRTRSGLASREGGTGLGLVIARGLIEAHGGTLSLESAPGRGSSFNVALPLAVVEEPKLQAASGEITDAPVPNSLVWVVSAHATSAQHISEVLRRYSARSAFGQLGVQVFSSFASLPWDVNAKPNLVILDPESSEQLKKQLGFLRAHLDDRIPILVLTEALDSATAFSLGASAILTKPLQDRDFLDSVTDLLNGLVGENL